MLKSLRLITLIVCRNTIAYMKRNAENKYRYQSAQSSVRVVETMYKKNVERLKTMFDHNHVRKYAPNHTFRKVCGFSIIVLL